MSYSFLMSFAPVPDKAAAYDLCQKAVNTLCTSETACEYAIDKWRFSHWHIFSEPAPKRHVLNLWTKSIMDVRFVYWPEHNLLALTGDYPAPVQSLFGQQIHFQNSTDQDYDMDCWDDNIPLFHDIKTDVSSMPDSHVHLNLYADDVDIPQNPDRTTYERKSLVYKRVFDALHLDEWLYGKDGRFERICMSGLTSQENTLEIQLRVRVAIRKKYYPNNEKE